MTGEIQPIMPFTCRSVLVRSALAAAAFAVLSIFVLDGPIAIALSSVPAEVKHALAQGLRACEWLFGFRITPYLYGGLLVFAGLTVMAWKRWTVGRLLLFIGLAHVTARFMVGIMKPPFSRLRPYEVLSADGAWHDTWFAAIGNSFPSGHAVHFWSLFFPLALLFPRYWIPLAVLPALVSAARVLMNDHYLSDVLASLAAAALVTRGYVRVLREGGQTVRTRETVTSLKNDD
jgi:membrane-associated phospholipid phosphatase